jgi:hypothetical protein
MNAKHLRRLPMNMTRFALLLALVLVLALQAEAAEQNKTTGDAKVSTSAAKPNYVPPLRGAPSGRIGGGTRGTTADDAYTLDVLAPDHVGLTTTDQPCLYWYIQKPTTHAIELTLTETGAALPTIEKRLPSPSDGGIQSLCLADMGVRLKQDTPYKWFVSVIPDPDNRSRDIIAGGMIQQRNAPAALQARLHSADACGPVCAYAEEGFWYDSFNIAMKELLRSPGSDQSHVQCASLLEQVGLKEIAAIMK